MTELPDLTGRGAIVTGSSRGVGADTAKFLAERGAGVVVNYRQKAPRAKKVVSAIEEAGGKAVAVGADITEAQGRAAMIQAATENFGELSILILNASGGMESDLGEDYAMRLNRDAQVALLTEAAEVMPEQSEVVFVTSHQAHFIDQVDTLPEYEQVARSKRAGEVALRAQIPALTAKGIRLVVATADMIEGTITATLLNRMRPGAIEARRQVAGKLYTVAEFAEEIAGLVGRTDLQTGHTEYVGGAEDFLAVAGDPDHAEN